MTTITKAPWQVQDELIEQPSWGGQYIIDLKGLDRRPTVAGEKGRAVIGDGEGGQAD